MQAGILRLGKRLEEVEAFDARSMSDRCPPELIALQAAVTRALERTFGAGSPDFKRFSSAGSLAWRPMSFTIGEPTPLREFQQGVGRNIDRSKALLKEAIRTLQEDLTEADAPSSAVEVASQVPLPAHPHRVFIVHGHDEGAREAVARFIEKIGFEAVILHERPNKGRTIITKFREEAAGIGFAIVLMTPDDHGGRAGAETRPRARQNVVFELGFFIGELGPERVAALVKGDIERPSDFDGVVYIPLDHGHWQAGLARELEAAGFEIDWNKAMRA
ncbi:nucleotide-binding protein [Methylobacterium soli]|uniref:Nucleotide-binding protein n=4 Tax=Methylobacterium soli TaxID=553447 RepID=A0A6L3SRW6_9HYPH|nr:nucleotide-binding protein [Methylobacterium soli]